MAKKKTTTKTQPPEFYRQGDVLILRSAAPSDAENKTPQNERIVLAYGEVTGHAHAIAPGGGVSLLERGSRRWLDVPAEGTVVNHEEHDAVPLGSGIWEIVIQKEYSPEALRNVAD